MLPDRAWFPKLDPKFYQVGSGFRQIHTQKLENTYKHMYIHTHTSKYIYLMSVFVSIIFFSSLVPQFLVVIRQFLTVPVRIYVLPSIQYHAGYQEQMSHWPEQPVNIIISWLKSRSSSLIVADFGCGENARNNVFQSCKLYFCILNTLVEMLFN